MFSACSHMPIHAHNSHNPRFLVNTINYLVNPSPFLFLMNIEIHFFAFHTLESHPVWITATSSTPASVNLLQMVCSGSRMPVASYYPELVVFPSSPKDSHLSIGSQWNAEFKSCLIAVKALRNLGCSFWLTFPTFWFLIWLLSHSTLQILLCVVPHINFQTQGDRASAVLTPTLSNVLPLSVRRTTNLDCFKKLLKTNLYREAFL